MGKEVGTEKLDQKADQPESSYKVLVFPPSMLPKDFRNMIFSNFLNGLRYGNEYFKIIDSSAYFANYNRYIDSLLSRPNMVAKIAVLSNEEDNALGWSLSEMKTLHFVYVKVEQRHQGIATSLSPKGLDTITHLTNIGLSIWNNKLKGVKFNPFA